MLERDDRLRAVGGEADLDYGLEIAALLIIQLHSAAAISPGE